MDEPLPRKVSEIRLTLASTLTLGSAASQGLERWDATAAVCAGDDPPTRVGAVSVLALDLLRCPDPWAALDVTNDEIAHIGATIFDELTGQLSEALDSRLAHAG